MGRQAPSKPGVAADLPMNARHTATRKAIEALPHTPANLRKSISYNAEHAAEHLATKADRIKELAKVEKDAAKDDKKAAKDSEKASKK